jgi:hypothetical protein
MSWWRWLRNDVNGRAYCLSFKAAKRSAALTDPVAFGLVTSQARPGTNVTGVLFRLEGLTGKQVEIALDLISGIRKIGSS